MRLLTEHKKRGAHSIWNGRRGWNIEKAAISTYDSPADFQISVKDAKIFNSFIVRINNANSAEAWKTGVVKSWTDAEPI